MEFFSFLPVAAAVYVKNAANEANAVKSDSILSWYIAGRNELLIYVPYFLFLPRRLVV